MLPTNNEISVRPAEDKDRSQLANMMHFETQVHRHLDWKPPLDWLGDEPYMIAEKAGKIVAALACPPSPPSVAWIRMFASTKRAPAEEAWGLLWPPTQKYLSQLPDISVAAIPLQAWFQELLANNGFSHVHNVIVLLWDNKNVLLPESKSVCRIRPMKIGEIPDVVKIDQAAFGPIWQNSVDGTACALEQSAYATVAEVDNKIVGYQISTPSPFGAHLARLAVDPSAQGMGIGYSIVRDLQAQYEGGGNRRISVNTQDHNFASLALYKKAGFLPTSEAYPVYQFTMN